MEELYLYGNHIGDERMVELAQEIKSKNALTNLRKLDLSNCAIGDNGLVAFAGARNHLKNLRELSLAANAFVDVDTITWSAIIAGLTKLRTEYVLYYEDQMEALVTALESNESLQTLHVEKEWLDYDNLLRVCEEKEIDLRRPFYV
jgi:Leucine-rich repeat (LRR) protein